MNKNYDDILNREPPAPYKRAAMSTWDRAAQFSSFAALTGFEEVIAETGRLTQRRPELTTDALEELDRAVQILLEDPRASARITWFRPDDRKDGGHILTSEGTVVKYDCYARCLLCSDGTWIPQDAVLSIELIL